MGRRTAGTATEVAALRFDAQAARHGMDGGVHGDSVDLIQVVGGQDVGRIARGVDPTAPEQHHLVGDRGGVTQVVQDDPDGSAVIVSEIPDQI